jgi:hypothetical protein
MLIDIADRYQIDAWSTPADRVAELEIHPDLLDLDGAMQLVVVVEPGARMFELDLGVKDDVVGNGVSWQQDDAAGVERILPLAAGGRILHGAEEDFAVGSDGETGCWGIQYTKYRLIPDLLDRHIEIG